MNFLNESAMKKVGSRRKSLIGRAASWAAPRRAKWGNDTFVLPRVAQTSTHGHDHLTALAIAIQRTSRKIHEHHYRRPHAPERFVAWLGGCCGPRERDVMARAVTDPNVERAMSAAEKIAAPIEPTPEELAYSQEMLQRAIATGIDTYDKENQQPPSIFQRISDFFSPAKVVVQV